MKSAVFSFLALLLASASAFQVAQPFGRPATTALSISKEEDMELTRKVIAEFTQKQDGGAPAPAPAPEEKKEKKEKAAAASSEE